MKLLGVVAAALILAGCSGGDSTGPDKTPASKGPAKVVVVSVTRTPTSSTSTDVDLTLRNDGGEGAYYIEFGFTGYGVGTSVGHDGSVSASPIDVFAGYKETVHYHVYHTGLRQTQSWIVVYSRAKGSGIWTKTGCAPCA